jgi:hypothetical protein
MSLKRSFIAAVVVALGLSGVASAQVGSSTNSAPSSASSAAPGCEDACCFKQSVVDGKTKFECVANWCQQKCELVYPKGADGKPDFNKKPGCGCNADQPPGGPQPPPTGGENCGSKTEPGQCGGQCYTADGKIGQCSWDKKKCACDMNPCKPLGIGRCGGPCTGEVSKQAGVCKVKSAGFIKYCGCDTGVDVISATSSAVSSAVSLGLGGK